MAPADGPPTPVSSTSGYLGSMSEPAREHPDYRMPPTQDELPDDDGEPTESPRHRRQRGLLVETLRWHHRDRPRVYIGANMAVHFTAWEEKRPAFKAPDFFVVLDADPTRFRKSWVTWEEEGGAGPNVIIELLSDSTEDEDRGRKMRIYAAARVDDYYLYDPHRHALEGYHRVPTEGWRPITARADGVLPCPTLGLGLALVPGEYEGEATTWLRWVNAEGAVLPTPAEHERAEADAQRAEADAQRARAERLAAALRAAGLDVPE